MIRPYRGVFPRIPQSAYVDQAAQVIGDVTLGERASVWPCAVLRGDVNRIVIGEDTNIQDGSVLHGELDKYPVIVGNRVTVGHMACLHGCVVEDDCLIGIGAIVLNGATDRAGLGDCGRGAGAGGHGDSARIDGDGHAGEGAAPGDARREGAVQGERAALHPLPPGYRDEPVR